MNLMIIKVGKAFYQGHLLCPILSIGVYRHRRINNIDEGAAVLAASRQPEVGPGK